MCGNINIIMRAKAEVPSFTDVEDMMGHLKGARDLITPIWELFVIPWLVFEIEMRYEFSKFDISARGGFRHDVRPNRGPHKKVAPTTGPANFCNIRACRK